MTGELRRRKPLLAAGAAALLLAAGAAPAQAAQSRIVYTRTSSPGGNFLSALYTVRANGTHRHRVGHDPKNAYTPAWSPNRHAIVFARDPDGAEGGGAFHLYTVRANGSHRRRVRHTGPAYEPAWSPNGKKLAYVGGNGSIFTIRLDGKHRRRLTDPSDDVGRLDWSPSGKSLVYAGPEGIVRMGANGHNPVVVSSSGRDPNWSPNGAHIAFTDLQHHSSGFTTRDIFTIRPDGTHLRDVTANRRSLCNDITDDCRVDDYPAWSPNGKRIAFEESDSDEPLGIFTIKLDGSGDVHVASRGFEPDW
jgi:TolB protein